MIHVWPVRWNDLNYEQVTDGSDADAWAVYHDMQGNNEKVHLADCTYKWIALALARSIAEEPWFFLYTTNGGRYECT